MTVFTKRQNGRLMATMRLEYNIDQELVFNVAQALGVSSDEAFKRIRQMYQGIAVAHISSRYLVVRDGDLTHCDMDDGFNELECGGRVFGVANGEELIKDA